MIGKKEDLFDHIFPRPTSLYSHYIIPVTVTNHNHDYIKLINSFMHFIHRRILGKGKNPAGIMVGHSAGITHVYSKGDGRYFISNGKDQCIKLWDIRMMDSSIDVKKVSKSSYDYRYGIMETEKLKDDKSIMTYKGHSVAKTLMRCYFSPMETTGQKYIYTGSSDGSILIYDVLSGQIITKLKGHTNIVRDLSWHPYLPCIVSTSWDTCIRFWDYTSHPSKENNRIEEDSD